MDNQTELLETHLGIRFKLTLLEPSTNFADTVNRVIATWLAGQQTLSRTLNVPHVRETGDHGDTEVEENHSVIQTLWFEREGRDIEKSEMKQLQALCEEAMQAAATANGVLCTSLPAKYVRKVEYLTFEDLNAE